MGNRAVITFGCEESSPAIQLHWNGGRASVEAFLEAARMLGLRHVQPTHRDEYRSDYAPQMRAMDWLAETLARFYFECEVGLNVYREPYGRADRWNGDHGVYVLAYDLSIVDRRCLPGMRHKDKLSNWPAHREEVNPAKTAAIIEHITARAPIFNN